MGQNFIQNTDEFEFSIFCIENVAQKLGVSGDKVYDAFTKKSDILNEYIVPCYDSLHTQSREYIVDDIISFMKEKGVSV